MIYYLVMERHASTMRHFLGAWGEALASRITIVHYEDILAGRPVRLGAGTYVFASLTDLGGPGSEVRAEAGRLYRELEAAFGAGRVINDPLSYLRRYDLLEALRERNINRFSAYRADGADVPARFPVFLRPEYGSKWEPPPLLNDAEEYGAAIRRAGDLTNQLAVEYCDTADASGIYRKYACFIVGSRIVPRHLFFSRSWWVKQADLCEPGMVEEELAFLESNPHAATLLEVSRIAGIGYGRIDYALLDGRVQVWEINHTPMIAGALSSEIPARQPVHRKFVALLSEALDAIDPEGA